MPSTYGIPDSPENPTTLPALQVGCTSVPTTPRPFTPSALEYSTVPETSVPDPGTLDSSPEVTKPLDWAEDFSDSSTNKESTKNKNTETASDTTSASDSVVNITATIVAEDPPLNPVTVMPVPTTSKTR
ncbi:hypothetical protein BDV98DRAFT_589968 [Pterulicium gracile]|uniref:Uncharacterized protein n=1 Tax=Pterulicium gracile TaxID=1884261 RepID=A0A5C3QTD5_9AGAR|nr:hypothetical protein BDV98DRAFT_589968 [Pterula gracilis]